MREPKQLSFFTPTPKQTSFRGREIGTFKDSLRAPIYRWFKYPAGFSYKFVQECIDLFAVGTDDWIYDPFAGTGTTLICAKQEGINSYGVEAHSFVHWVSQVKLYWNFDLKRLYHEVESTLQEIENQLKQSQLNTPLDQVFPALIHKCYHPNDLAVLYFMREFISLQVSDNHLQNLLKLALTDTLRGASIAGTGWPYISPPKTKTEQHPKDAWKVFQKTIRQMVQDIKHASQYKKPCQILNILGDSRQRQQLADEQVQLAITSPPYLNNYDYADRTRLETYFWGITTSWQEITQQFRDKLIVAATTQIRRSDHQVETALRDEIRQAQPQLYHTLQTAILTLSERRLEKGGKKDYDLMTALYFNDMLDVLCESYRVLARGAHFCLVLGDSAPYGVHIATDTLIGELALGLGFSEYAYHELRKRGDKWKDNPQRHDIPLREGIIILKK